MSLVGRSCHWQARRPSSLFARHHLDVDDDAGRIIDGGVLLVGRLQALLLRTRRHGGVRVRRAELLELARRAGQPILLAQISGIDRIEVLLDQRVEADVGADQRRVDMHDLARREAGIGAGAHDPREDRPEPIHAPALADACQR